MFPKRVLVMTGYHNDWLYKSLMNKLREAYGTTFYIVASENRFDEFRQLCADGDEVVNVNFPGSEFLTDGLDAEAVFAVARGYEHKYGLRYMMDILQQDAGHSAYFLGYSQNSPHSKPKASKVSIYDKINRSFAYFEKLLSEQKIDAIINRPNGLDNTVMTAVADSMGIPTTFFHGSYFQGDAVWASGPYMGSEFYQDVYEATPEVEELEELDIDPNATWTRPPAPSYSALAKKLILLVVNYAEFAYSDFRRGKKGNRVSFAANFISEIKQFRVQRFVNWFCDDDLDGIAREKFVYMALPFEPEFTIQSLCRQFADTNAVIRQVALALPAGYNLVLKEHQRIGNRSIDYYTDWLKYPNIKIAHPGLRGVDMIRRCEATVTMGGSTPMEAASMGKPSIVFGTQNPYGILPSIRICTNLRELPDIFEETLRDRDEAEILDIRKAAARFKEAYSSKAFDVTGTILFRSGTKTEISPEQLDRATEAFVEVMAAQRDRLAAGK